MTPEEYARWVEGYFAAKAGSPLTQEDCARIAAKAREIVPAPMYIPLPPVVTPYVPQPYIPPWTFSIGGVQSDSTALLQN